MYQIPDTKKPLILLGMSGFLSIVCFLLFQSGKNPIKSLSIFCFKYYGFESFRVIHC